MNNRKRLYILILALYNTLFMLNRAVYAEVREAASASYSDVVEAIEAASSGDHVIVPSGIATWSSVLKITKGISSLNHFNSFDP